MKIFILITRLCVFLFFMLFVTGCADGWTKQSPGLYYKILSHGQGYQLQYGETIKMHVRQLYKDSVLSDSRGGMPVYQKFDSVLLSRESYEIFRKIRQSDSLVFKALSDSAFHHKWPPFAQKGEWLYTEIKIVEILGARQDVKEDMEAERKKLVP